MFYRQPKQTQQFCSRTCAYKAVTKTPVLKQCAHCGKELRLKPSQAERQYCSKACDAQHRTKRPLDWLHNGKPARKDRQGYVMVWEPTHPNGAFHGWQYQHRLVVEAKVGRHLMSDEHVHHVNGIKDDNRIENLEVMDGLAHVILSGAEYHDHVRRELAELAEYRRIHGSLTRKDSTAHGND